MKGYKVEFKLIEEHVNGAEKGETWIKEWVNFLFVPRKGDTIKLGDIYFRIDYSVFDTNTDWFKVEMYNRTYDVVKSVKKLETDDWKRIK